MSRFVVSCAAVLSLASASAAPTALVPLRIYRLGNSLTYQSSTAGLARMLEARGFAGATLGYHVNCGSSLINTWDHPDQTCKAIPSVPGIFTTALPGGDWDALSAQPFAGPGSTLGTDTEVIRNLLLLTRQRPANAHSPVFIYAVHPYRSDRLTYAQQWTATTPDSGPRQPTVASREYYRRLYDRLVPEVGAASLSMIPAGEVLQELDRRMQRGEIPGYTDAYQLYSDAIHLDNAGDYILGVTTLAALTGQDPWGLTAPPPYGPTNLTAAQYDAIHDAIWTVLCRDPAVRPLGHSAHWPYKVHRIAHLGDRIVRTRGTLVEAVNLGSADPVTVNGVTFQGSLTRDGLTRSHRSDDVFGDAGGATAGLATLMNSFASSDGAGSAAEAGIVLRNLVAGTRYEVQLFLADQRTAATRSRRQEFLLAGEAPLPIQEGLGCSITGAFIAHGTTETLTLRALPGTDDPAPASPMLNGFQLRQVDQATADLETSEPP